MADIATRYNPISQAATTFPRTIGVPADSAKWEAWFGPMPDKPAPSPFSNYPIEHKTLPDAYMGENVFLAEKISGLVNTTGDFWTNRLLPWQQSQHIGPFTWSEWKFNQVLATRLPHEGVPRLITTSEKTFMARPIRRGLAAEFEGDFVNHPKGQIAMARKIQGMVVSIHTTINMDCQHTILMANESRKSDWAKTGLTRVPIGFEIDMEIDSFNAIGKNPTGFVNLTKRIRRYLIDSGAQTPLVLLVTPETPMEMALNYVTEPKSYRLVGGDPLRGPTGELGKVVPDGDFILPDGTNVIEVKDMNIDVDAPPEQLFTRNVMIGEYNTISWEERSKANLYDGCGSPSGRYAYCSDHRSILIHDAELDEMAKITLRECIIYGGLNSGFPDMSLITQLAQRNYHPKDFYPTTGNDGDRDRRRNQASHMKRQAHMMLFYQKNNGTRVVRHFGNMDDNVTSSQTFRQIGQTLARRGISFGEEDQADADNLVLLMQELEEAPFNETFFEQLVSENLVGGNFQGEKLSAQGEDLARKYGYEDHHLEWKPQDHGGLKVPNLSSGLPAIPPGLASLAGLYGLSRANYGELSERATKSIRLIQKLYNKWKEAIASEALRADNRAPWYHVPNGMYTFFDNVIYMPRDPLFLATTEPGSVGTAGGQIPLDFERIYTDIPGTSPETRFGNFEVSTTEREADGGAAVLEGSYIEDIYSILFKMGRASGPALVGVMTSLDANEKKEFAEMLKATKKANARKIVLGIYNAPEPNEDAVRRLLSADTTRKDKMTMLKKYTAEAADIPDADIPAFDSPLIYQEIKAAASRPEAGPHLYRAPLVMTPGIARTLPRDAEIIRPSDPTTGHTLPIHEGDIPRNVKDRAQYASFVGSMLRNRQSEHSTWLGHHMEYLTAKANGRISSSMGGGGGSASSYSRGNLFSASSFGDDELFDETSVVESIASTVGAREPHQWKDPSPGESFASRDERFDRRRPFGYLGRALVGDYNGGRDPIDEKDGHRLIFEFDTDNMRQHMASASKIMDNPIVRWGALAAVMSRCDGVEYWTDMIDADVLVPCNAMLLRFRQEFLTDSFVMMEPGPNTGGTLFNNASSIIGWDVITRRLHLNFAFYSKALVWNPKNIYVMENAQIQRYIRGRGIRFITNVDQIASDSRRESYDIVSVIVPIEENRFGNERSGIGILGESQAGQTDRNNAIDPDRYGVDYSSAGYVDLWFTATDISLKDIIDDSNRVSGRFLESQDALPRLLYQGHQQNYNYSEDNWSVIVHCRGHLGRNGSYPGVVQVYNRTPAGGYFLDQDPHYPTNVA
jgi:hypothetical protein